MTKSAYIWLILIYSVISCCYLLAARSPWTVWLLAWMTGVASVYLMCRLASLVLPHQVQGPILGVAFVALAPRFASLPAQVGLQNAGILLSALAALVATKTYLRDGPKAGSLVTLGASLGMGAALFPAFVQVFPTILPALAAGRDRRGIMRAAAFVGGAFLIVFLVMSRSWPEEAKQLIPGTSAVPVYDSYSADLALDAMVRFLASLVTFAEPRAGAVVAFYIFLSLAILAGILRSLIPTGSRLPWQRLWRTAPLIGVIALTGVLSAAGWALFSLIARHSFPPTEDLFLAGPWMALLAALGFANLADWIRKQRSIGNVIAGNLVVYVLTLQSLANVLCLFFYLTASTSR